MKPKPTIYCLHCQRYRIPLYDNARHLWRCPVCHEILSRQPKLTKEPLP